MPLTTHRKVLIMTPYKKNKHAKSLKFVKEGNVCQDILDQLLRKVEEFHFLHYKMVKI